MSPFEWFVAALCGWILREQDDAIASCGQRTECCGRSCADGACSSVTRNGDVWYSKLPARTGRVPETSGSLQPWLARRLRDVLIYNAADQP